MNDGDGVGCAGSAEDAPPREGERAEGRARGQLAHGKARTGPRRCIRTNGCGIGIGIGISIGIGIEAGRVGVYQEGRPGEARGGGMGSGAGG